MKYFCYYCPLGANRDPDISPTSPIFPCYRSYAYLIIKWYILVYILYNSAPRMFAFPLRKSLNCWKMNWITKENWMQRNYSECYSHCSSLKNPIVRHLFVIIVIQGIILIPCTGMAAFADGSNLHFLKFGWRSMEYHFTIDSLFLQVCFFRRLQWNRDKKFSGYLKLDMLFRVLFRVSLT